MNRNELIEHLHTAAVRGHTDDYNIAVDLEEHPNLRLVPRRDFSLPIVYIYVDVAPGPPYGHFNVTLISHQSGYQTIENMKIDEAGFVYYR